MTTANLHSLPQSTLRTMHADLQRRINATADESEKHRLRSEQVAVYEVWHFNRFHRTATN